MRLRLSGAVDFWSTLRPEIRFGDRGSLRAHLIRSAGGSFALKVSSTLLSVMIGALLARNLGASGFGIYAYAFAWLELLKIPAALGLPMLVTREVAVYCARQDWGRLRGLLVRANQAVLGMSLVLMLLAGGASWLLADWFQNPSALTTFWLALLLLPIFGLGNLRGACLTGLQRVVLGQVPDVVRAVLFLCLIVLVWLLGGAPFIPEEVMALQIVAVSCAFVLGSVWLLRSLPPEVKRATPIYDTRAWAGRALPFLSMGGLALITSQTDIIMIGWFGTSTDVGIYRVASIAASLMVFPLGCCHSVLFPTIARLHTEGDMARLQRIIMLSTRAVLLFALPVAFCFIVAGAPLLSAVFGPDYAIGATALAVLTLGYLVLAGTGSAGPLLSMTGHAQDEAKINVLSALLNVALNVLLIPFWGINGAAVASAASLTTRDVLVTVMAHRRVGVQATAFGALQLRLRRRAARQVRS
jgi:O-antigen/teichoic acid export membrane protein